MFSIKPEIAEFILKTISDYFAATEVTPMITDVGSWTLSLTNSKGEKRSISGSLIENAMPNDPSLSEMLRQQLNREELLAFDGNPDKIKNIKVSYSRCVKIKPAQLPPDATWEYVTIDLDETLTIDRQAETIELLRHFGTGIEIKFSYHVEEGIVNFLDSFPTTLFSEIGETPADIVDNPLDVRSYKVNVLTRQGECREIEGYYDKTGLPTDWSEFMEALKDFLSFYGLGELLNKSLYEKARRRASDLIYCKVSFEEYGQQYSYIADEDIYKEGDYVRVPAGRDNHEATVLIEEIDYYAPEDAPFPPEKTKHIIRKCSSEETAEYVS